MSRMKVVMLLVVLIEIFVSAIYLPKIIYAGCYVCEGEHCRYLYTNTCNSYDDECDSNADCGWPPPCYPNCNCAANTCEGSTCINSCGTGSCTGYKECCSCSGTYFRCSGSLLQRCDGCNWGTVENCPYGCSEGICLHPEVCEDKACGDNACDGGNNLIWCWYTAQNKKDSPNKPDDDRCVYNDGCSVGECHPHYETCGGNANCDAYPGTVSHIDNCGGLNCAAPCSSSGGSSSGGCTITNPNSVTQSSPANGASFNKVTTVTLDWSDNSTWGNECSGTDARRYTVCVGTNSSTPCDENNGGYEVDVTGGDAPPSTAVYTQSLPGTYYWKVKSVNKGNYASSWSETRNFVITNHAPTIVSTSTLEINSSGTSSLSLVTSDADGASDISTSFLAFNSCVVDPGAAGWSNFEHLNANFFGSVSNAATNQTSIASNNANAACTGTVASPTTPWTTGPASNAGGTISISGSTNTVNGNNLTTLYNVTTNNFPKGNYNFYAMVSDAENLWHTGNMTASWRRMTNLCVDGFSTTDTSYVSAWSPWSACDNVTHTRTRTRTCTEDCNTINECAGVTLSETENCVGRIQGHLYDASDCVVGCSCAGSSPIGPNNISVSGLNLWSISPNPLSVAVGVDGAYSFDAFLGSTNNTFTFDFANLLASGQVGDANPKVICDEATPSLLGCDPSYVGPAPCQPNPARVFDFGFYRKYGGWWQVTGGSVHANENVSSTIPASVPPVATFDNQRLILQDANGKDGLITYGNVLDLGTNPNKLNSESNRTFRQDYDGVYYDYSFFDAKFRSYSATDWSGGLLPVYSDPEGRGYMLVRYTGGGTLDFGGVDVQVGQKYLVLAPGNVDVNGYVTVAQGGFFSLISGGTIAFNPSLGRDDIADNSASKVFAGWYLGEGINFGTTGDEDTEKQFYGEGSFVSWGSMGMVRNWGVKNNLEAPQQIVYRADFLQNAPEILRSPYRVYAPLNP